MIAADQIDGGFSPRQAAAVAGVELDGEAVLYHEQLRTVCVLNPSATLVWNCLDGSSDLDGLISDLADVFATDLGQVRHDVLEAVRELGRQGLLEDVVPDPDVVADHTLPGPDDSLEAPHG